MPYGLYISAAGAHVQSERLRVLTNNLANADTPGFKRELAVFQAQHAEAIARGEAQPGSGSINDIGGGVRFAETVTDFQPGSVRKTGADTDLAIEGEGFFLVEKDGQELLTRAGNFHFSADGRLLTDQGYAVLSADGQPLGVDPRVPWSVSDSGALQQAGTQTYLALVKPRSLGDLVKAGSNLFSPLAPVVPVPWAERRVLQGMLEQSGAVPYQEMTEMLETSRAFESNVRMIQNHDQMMGSLVNRVLRPA